MLKTMSVLDRRNKMIRKIVILIPMFFLFLALDNCKSPASPGEPPIQYQHQFRDTVEFTYKRDSTKIIVTDHEHIPVPIRYILIDSSGNTYGPGEEYSSTYGLRIGDVWMEKIGKYKFRFYFKHVRIIEEVEDIDHVIILWDEAISPHPIDEKDITLEGAHDIRVTLGPQPSTTYIWFKMSID